MESDSDTKQLCVIYIPGLGDHRVYGQRKAVRAWRFWGVEPLLFVMRWYDAEPWELKFDRLLQYIDGLANQGKQIALVGVSAGAAAVMVAYAARTDKVVGCVLISGKVNRPEAIGQHYRIHNPAFVSCAYACQKVLSTLGPQERRRILSRYALVDGVVFRPDSKIPGAQNKMVPSIGHAITIALQITFGAPGFLRFLKRLSG